MLGGEYSSADRHTRLDDGRIPDFTASRCYDGCLDILELKQPFLPLFKRSGEFSANFNDAWNQSERYVDFVDRQRGYLREEKRLLFENAQCVLLIGHELNESELEAVRSKQRLARRITVRTWDQLAGTARHMVNLVELAGQPIDGLPRDT